jgi:hypothetical protein
MRYSAVVASIILATSQLVAGHGAIVKAVGDQGGQGSAIGSKLCCLKPTMMSLLTSP